MVERVAGGALAAAAAAPLAIAVTDRHLDGASTALTVSVVTSALAVPAIAVQPLLAGSGRVRRHRLLGTVALILAALLGGLRGRLPLSPMTWRVLHAYLAVVVIVLGFGHALATDGALDGIGTAVLLSFGALGLLGVPAAHLARTRRRRG